MDFDFGQWWDGLTTIQQIYWGFAIPSTLIFLLQTILTFVGGDSDMDGTPDVDVETDHGGGFQFFTFKNLIAFFTMFSWTGIASLNAGFSTPMSVLIAFVAGIIIMTIMGALFYYFSKLTDSGTLNTNNAVGGVGEVYLPIHAKRGNIGKVSIKVQSSFRELDAMTDDDLDLPTGTVVNVVSVIKNDILVVTKSI
jgi:membrane protein implicated in regulation of membrane protease activity